MEVIKLFLREVGAVDGFLGADEVDRISGAIVDGLASVDDSVLFIASDITEIFALITNNARRIDSFLYNTNFSQFVLSWFPKGSLPHTLVLTRELSASRAFTISCLSMIRIRSSRTTYPIDCFRSLIIFY